jgi:hypothetical protein
MDSDIRKSLHERLVKIRQWLKGEVGSAGCEPNHVFQEFATRRTNIETVRSRAQHPFHNSHGLPVIVTVIRGSLP